MNDFLDLLEAESGQPISRCYQCKKCSGGCPVSSYTDIRPHQVVRLAQLGRQEELLASPGIWYCTGCMTCQARCPNGISISAILDVIKGRALKAGDLTAESLPFFHDCFLASVRHHGRVFELGMVAGYKWRSKRWTDDKGLGARMFLKGKLALLPNRCSNSRQIREIFQIELALRKKEGGKGNG